MDEACGGGRGRFYAAVRCTTPSRAFAGLGTWVPVLALPITAAEQVPPLVWAMISLQVKEKLHSD